MDRQLKQRVVGAAVLVVLGVIFIPLFLDQGTLETRLPDVVTVPPPTQEFVSELAPVDDAEIEILEQLSEQRIEIPDSEAAVPDSAESALPPAPPAPPVPPATAEEQTPAPAVTTAPAAAVQPQSVPRTVAAPPRPPTRAPAAASPAVTRTTGGPGWAVQVGSFASQDNATRLTEKLRNAELPAYIEQRQEQSGTVFKVRVGPQPDRAEAEQMRAKLAQRFGLDGMLLQQP